MIRLKRLQYFKGKWRLKGITLPDEKDYILIYKCNTINDCMELTGLHRQTVYERINSLSRNILDRPPKAKLSLLSVDEDTIKLFMISV